MLMLLFTSIQKERRERYEKKNRVGSADAH